MDRRRFPIYMAAVVAVLALACKQPLDIGSFSVAGQWKGSVKQTVGLDSARYNFVFDLEQNERSVSGTATIASGTDTVEADVSGRWEYPAVTLHLTADGFAPLDYAASFATRDTLKGPLTGSGFNSTTLSIIRQATP